MSTDRPLVSIGVPTYNRANLLDRALDRLLNQTYANLQIIVADNASIDETPNVARKHAQNDDRVRYVRHGENLGPADNYAFVLDKAEGDYFMWHADDDYLEPAFVEETVHRLEKDSETVLCFSDYRFVDENDEETGEMRLEQIYPDVDWSKARREFFSHPFWSSAVCIYGVYDIGVIREVGPLRPVLDKAALLGCEAPLLSAVAARGRIVAVPEILFNYLQHDIHGNSLAHLDGLSAFDVLQLQARKQREVLKNALSADGSIAERASLAGTCIQAAIRKIGHEISNYEPGQGS